MEGHTGGHTRLDDSSWLEDEDAVDGPLVCRFFAASLIFLLVALIAGLFYSLQFLQAYPLRGIEAFSPGRWRMIHTTTMVYGFSMNAFWGATHLAVPRISGRGPLSRKLSWCFFGLWQSVVVASILGIAGGAAQGVEWGETPVFVDWLVVAALVLLLINWFRALWSGAQTGDVSCWYFLVGMIWSVIVYAMGNFRARGFLDSEFDIAADKLFAMGLMGMMLAPFALGMAYHFTTRLIGRILWGHRLALLGFWSFALFYPFSQLYVHAKAWIGGGFVFVLSMVMVTFSGLAVCITLVGTVLRGRAGLRNSLPLYWFFGGLMFLLLITLQFAVQGLLLTPGRLSFSDWSMAHAHAALFGVFGFWIMGMMTQVFPRLLGATGWYRPVWNTWHLWLTTVGLVTMFFVLLVAGYQQSAVEPAIANVEPSLLDSRAFWLVRMLAGVVVIAGQVFFLLNVLMTAVQARWPVGAKDRVDDYRRVEQSQEPRTVRRLSTPVTALLCTLTMGFVPVVWLWLPSGSSEPTAADWASRGLTHEFVQLRENFPARFDEYFGPVNETSFEEALTVGRTVFAGEGCWNCHTRTFAPTPASALGLQTLAVQSAGASTSGSRRIGPDLVGEAAPKSNDWHLAHFYKPTGIVPYSVMPEYPWLTDEKGYPNRRGMALITYVQWLAALGEAGPYRSFSP